MKIRLKSLTAVILAALLLMSACTNSNPGEGATDSTAADTATESIFETESGAASETEAETEPEVPVQPAPSVVLTANTLTADTDKLVLKLSCDLADEQFQGELIGKLSDADRAHAAFFASGFAPKMEMAAEDYNRGEKSND